MGLTGAEPAAGSEAAGHNVQGDPLAWIWHSSIISFMILLYGLSARELSSKAGHDLHAIHRDVRG